MKTILIKNIHELKSAATQFISVLQSDYKNCYCIAFYGVMAAGKTTFIAEVCKQLGVVANVSSPTFAIINEYKATNNSLVYHFDLYRINTIAELQNIGISDYIYGNSYCFIEWPEIAESLLPSDTVFVRIEEQADTTRIIKFLR